MIDPQKVIELQNKYKQELMVYGMLDDIPNFEKTWNGARRLLILKVIEDLESLLK